MKIKRITVTNRMIPMCDITVQDVHTYIYNGVVVHNSTRSKGRALLVAGIDTGKVTNSNQMALDKDTMADLATKYKKEIKEYNSKSEYYDEQDAIAIALDRPRRIPYEIVPMMLERSSLRKQLSSYTEKLSQVSSGFISYKLFEAACLNEDAMILSKTRGYLSIKDIVIGDEIWTVQGWDKVINWIPQGEQEVYQVKFSDGRELTGTWHHPVMVNRNNESGLIFLRDLKEGDILTQLINIPDNFNFLDNQNVKVKSVEKLDDKQLVYDITMDKEPLFIANGFITHNTGRMSSGGGSDYFLNLNYQNLTKPKPAIYRAFHKTHRIYNSDLLKDCKETLDYKFIEVKDNEYVSVLDKDGNKIVDSDSGKVITEIGQMIDPNGGFIEDSMYIVESTKQELNIRSAITVPNDDWLFCVDKNSTYIELEDGNSILIHELEEMIKINPELKIKTPYGYYRVLNYFDTGKKKKCILKLKDGRTINCSQEHKFKIQTQDELVLWQQLKDIKATDIILDSDELKKEHNSNIEFIQFTNDEIDMCDIEVEEVHSYFANGLLTHNCSQDYSAEEVVIAANLSAEKNYLDPLLKGEDIHKAVAIQMFGQANYDKSARKKAKFCTFGLLYGGSKTTLMTTSKLDLKTCEDLYNKYWMTMITLKNWMISSVKKARFQDDGNVYTYFGRPRRLKFYLAHTDQGQQAFGERSVTSHKIQGLCGDLMRIVLVKMYKNIFSKKENLEEIQFSGCVHDEINTVIRKDCIYKWYPVMKNLMEQKIKSHKLQLTTSFEAGTSYGTLFPFEINEATGLFEPKHS